MRRWNVDEKGVVTVYIPKFRGRHFGPWLTSLMKNPEFNIRLDEIGSAVWQCCDGAATVFEIGEKLKDRFGEGIEPVHDRLVVFISQMIRGDLVSCDPPEDQKIQTDPGSRTF